MNKIAASIRAGIFITILGMATISEAQAMEKQGLDAKQKSVATIAAFTATGDLNNLKTALDEGLDAGLTINEIKEILIQMYAYAGFPRSLNGIDTFMGLLDERQRKGIKDVPGKGPSTLPPGKSSIELGTEVQTRLVGKPVTGPMYTFVPTIDQFLKGHLFGDIFGRNVLNYQEREIATIAALASMGGVNPQLQGHFNIGLNVGLTPEQLRSLISVLASRVGKKQAENANELLDKVLSNRSK